MHQFADQITIQIAPFTKIKSARGNVELTFVDKDSSRDWAVLDYDTDHDLSTTDVSIVHNQST